MPLSLPKEYLFHRIIDATISIASLTRQCNILFDIKITSLPPLILERPFKNVRAEEWSNSSCTELAGAKKLGFVNHGEGPADWQVLEGDWEARRCCWRDHRKCGFAGEDGVGGIAGAAFGEDEDARRHSAAPIFRQIRGVEIFLWGNPWSWQNITPCDDFPRPLHQMSYLTDIWQRLQYYFEKMN